MYYLVLTTGCYFHKRRQMGELAKWCTSNPASYFIYTVSNLHFKHECVCICPLLPLPVLISQCIQLYELMPIKGPSLYVRMCLFLCVPIWQDVCIYCRPHTSASVFSDAWGSCTKISVAEAECKHTAQIPHSEEHRQALWYTVSKERGDWWAGSWTFPINLAGFTDWCTGRWTAVTLSTSTFISCSLPHLVFPTTHMYAPHSYLSPA